MRIDDYLSTVGVIKRRTVAKEMAKNGLVSLGDRKIKASQPVRIGDIIAIGGTRAVTIEVLDIPTGSVPKEKRDVYFRVLPQPS